MSLFPIGERIQTLSPGQPIPAELINRMQDGTVQTTAPFHPLRLSLAPCERQLVGGTWAINNTLGIAESANAVTCRVPIPCPIGARLLSVRLLGRQLSGATDQFTVQLVEIASAVTTTALGTIATSSGAIVGSDQTITSSIDGGYETLLDRRYAVQLGTTGGGGGSRAFYTITVFLDLV